jgi:hypothetical protein
LTDEFSPDNGKLVAGYSGKLLVQLLVSEARSAEEPNRDWAPGNSADAAFCGRLV